MSDEHISVTFRLYGLGQKLAHGETTLTRHYPPGTTVWEALRDLGVRHEAEVSVLIGGRVVSAAAKLQPDGVLVVVPPLVGGA